MLCPFCWAIAEYRKAGLSTFIDYICVKIMITFDKIMIIVYQFKRILFSDLCCSVLFDKRKGLVSFLSETVTKEEVRKIRFFFLSMIGWFCIGIVDLD